MPMAMMQIRIMRVFVAERRVAVPMRMRLGHRAVMDMAVVVVMAVKMIVLDGIVHMIMFVAFGQMQPQADPHQESRSQERDGRRLAKDGHGDQGADEGRE